MIKIKVTEKNISISSADGTVFYYDYGEPILTCDISDLENQFLNCVCEYFNVNTKR